MISSCVAHYLIDITLSLRFEVLFKALKVRIANPMSERTRGFEMLLMDGNAKVPLPALFSLAIFMNFLNITASVVN